MEHTYFGAGHEDEDIVKALEEYRLDIEDQRAHQDHATKSRF
jgi:hypothetical protein